MDQLEHATQPITPVPTGDTLPNNMGDLNWYSSSNERSPFLGRPLAYWTGSSIKYFSVSTKLGRFTPQGTVIKPT